jgi:hypothetical protein
MPAVAAADDRPRLRFADELDRLAELPDDLAAVALEVARDLEDGAPLTPFLGTYDLE